MEFFKVRAPKYFIGEAFRIEGSPNYYTVKANFWSEQDSCFLYTFDRHEKPRIEYIPEDFVTPVFHFEPLKRAATYDKGEDFTNEEYRYHYKVLKDSPICFTAEYDRAEVSSLVVENLEYVNEYFYSELIDKFDRTPFHKLDIKGNPSFNFFVFDELLSILIALPIYDIGLKTNLWTETELLRENYEWSNMLFVLIYADSKSELFGNSSPALYEIFFQKYLILCAKLILDIKTTINVQTCSPK